MKLNENDARAVDILLDGMPLGPTASAADGSGNPGTSTGAAGQGFGSPRTASTVSAMSDDLAKRVSRADDMLRLLDYLPVDEPSESLVQRTLKRVEEARMHAARPAARVTRPSAAAQAGGAAGGTLNAGLQRSPDPIDSDPTNP